jgi:hypothetical protein
MPEENSIKIRKWNQRDVNEESNDNSPAPKRVITLELRLVSPQWKVFQLL